MQFSKEDLNTLTLAGLLHDIGKKFLDVDVLKLGHHGSRTSSSQKFLEQINPKLIIISCGKNNDYGHPNEKIIERLNNAGAEIFRTDESGTIEVIVTE